jgi:hypothetical protein
MRIHNLLQRRGATFTAAATAATTAAAAGTAAVRVSVTTSVRAIAINCSWGHKLCLHLGYQLLHVLLLFRSDALTTEHLAEVFGKALYLLLGAAVHRATVLADQALCASPGRFITEQLANRLVKRSQVAFHCLPLPLGLGCLCCQFCVAVLDKPPVYKVAAGAVCALGFGCCGFSTAKKHNVPAKAAQKICEMKQRMLFMFVFKQHMLMVQGAKHVVYANQSCF